jgi:hypothetical protein
MNAETEPAQWRLCPPCGREQIADKQIVQKLLASGMAPAETERYAEDHIYAALNENLTKCAHSTRLSEERGIGSW